MANFANLTANLNLNIQNFASNMRRASSIANQFSANLKGQINDGLVEPAKKSKFEFKDAARIVQGIMISKVFYSGLHAIRNATDAVWQFSQELEYAKTAYSNLFGDTALADEFINVLKDFAATTPFSFTESEAAAKRLLAYGIQYKNVMYVMQGVLAASSVQGNPQVIESASRALGQIYTKGRLMNEEMRQLAEAGIPAYEILQEKLGLTQKQLQNLGKEGIPASKAVNALVDGMNERFGGVVAASSKTLKGITSNIKDNATMLISGAFEPLITYIKSGLNELGEFLLKMREIFELKGLGGVFEAIFPPELHSTIRMFVANLMALHQASLRLVASLSGLLKPVLEALLRVYNAFVPILTTILNVLSVMVSWTTQNATAMKILTAALAAAAAMWVVFKVKALATVVVASVIRLISKALAGLSAMLTFVAAHPFWSLLIALTGLVVGLSGGFGKLSDAISSMFKKITAINGIDPDKVLLPSQKERANDLNKFNEALDDTKDSMDELADSTGKATKAAKGLLSFDEVFKLNQPDEGTSKGIDTDTDFEMPDLSGLDASSFIPGVPSFEGFANNFVTDMINALKEKFIGAGIGAIIGGILGGILGGPLGAKIGAIAGAIAGWFWNDLANALGLTDIGKVAVPIATGLGAVIGALIGGPFGAVIGAGIGALVGWLIDSIARGFENGDWSQVGYPVGIGVGAGIGFIVGGPAGAAIGAAIGALVGWISDIIVTGVTTGDWDFSKLGLGLGTGIGAAIGMVAGGPVGAAIGAAVGALISWLVGLIADNWDSITQWFSDVWTGLTTWFQDILNTITDKVQEAWTVVSTWFQNIWDTISEKLSGAWQAVSTWFQNIWSTISEKLSGAWQATTQFFSDILTTITSKVKEAWTVVSTWFQNIWSTISEKLSGAWQAVTKFFSDILTTITGKVKEAWTAVSTWFQNIWNTISEKLSGAWQAVTDFFGKIYTSIKTKVSDSYTVVKDFFGNMYTSIKTAIGDMYTSVKDGIGNIYKAFKDWISNLWSNVFGKFFDWINTGIDKLKEFFGLDSKAKNTDTSYAYSRSSGPKIGHATGGIFNREHIARFAEGNKAEAVIPLENAGAMQPFVDAVANGITASLMPIVANISGGQNQLQPLYVGTLIADERSLKELNRKMQVIQLQENKRRG
jgi:tape measure domain-containing protein